MMWWGVVRVVMWGGARWGVARGGVVREVHLCYLHV